MKPPVAKKPERERTSNKYIQSLRSNSRFVLNPRTQLRYELKINMTPKVVCPPLKRQIKSLYNPDLNYGAVALGMKGKLSKLYNRGVKITYLNQMFTKVNNIGQGSFGDVYTYRSHQDGKCYAIKVLKRFHSNEKYGEIRRLDLLGENEYCTKYLNAWEEFGNIFIQFELGQMSLADYAKKNHSISEAECWNIAHDVIKGLRALHERGLAHLDIKPDNILIGFDGKYRLCDFGLLTDISTVDFDRSFLLSEGDSKYLAGEVLRGELSTAGDIFSLGITILELCTDLVLPDSGPCWHDLRDGTWGYVNGMSCNLSNLVYWMMKQNPSDRPTAEQVACTDEIKRLNRLRKPRTNYFEQWRVENAHMLNEVPLMIMPPRPMDPAEETSPDGRHNGRRGRPKHSRRRLNPNSPFFNRQQRLNQKEDQAVGVLKTPSP